jgi:hypothetical protein
MLQVVKPKKKASPQRGESTMKSENNENLGDVMMIPRAFARENLVNQIFRFRRSVVSATIQQAAGSDTLGAFSFTLAGIQGNSEWTTLFDQYKISLVRVLIRPLFNLAQIVALSTDVFPPLCSVIDYDDATAISNVLLSQYQSYKQTRFDKDHVRSIKPRVAMAAYGSGVFASFANQGNQWIDCASAAVVHYGLKYCIQAGDVGQTALQAWSVETEYFLEFRQVR